LDHSRTYTFDDIVAISLLQREVATKTLLNKWMKQTSWSIEIFFFLGTRKKQPASKKSSITVVRLFYEASSEWKTMAIEVCKVKDNWRRGEVG